MKLLSRTQNRKIPGRTMCYFEVVTREIPEHTMCYFEVAFTREGEMLILLNICAIPGHSYKRDPKISYITMRNGESAGTFVRYRY